MPELPEVEIISRSLNKLISGQKIISAKLLRKKLVKNISPQEFSQKISDASINFVHRRGKYILFDLDNNKTLITHLRMSGKFQLLSFEKADPKFTHAVFYFGEERRLVFSDQRHFGFMQIAETDKLCETKELRILAPEPFSAEFSQKYLKATLKRSSKKIKELILDQTKVCGLGNIYAAEALFLARIHPEKPANEISSVKSGRLHKFIRQVLKESIDHGLALNINPENLEENYYWGANESQWFVYDRENEPCNNCRALIKRLKQGGRSSYFCPRCQRK